MQPGFIYVAWGPPKHHSSEFAEYDSINYLESHTAVCYNSRF